MSLGEFSNRLARIFFVFPGAPKFPTRLPALQLRGIIKGHAKASYFEGDKTQDVHARDCDVIAKLPPASVPLLSHRPTPLFANHLPLLISADFISSGYPPPTSLQTPQTLRVPQKQEPITSKVNVQISTLRMIDGSKLNPYWIYCCKSPHPPTRQSGLVCQG